MPKIQITQLFINDMVFSENDIKNMVRESVERVLSEERHVINDNLKTLAKIIYRKALFGGGYISPDVINKYNPYYKTEKPLKVCLFNNNGSSLASFDYEKFILSIKKTHLFSREIIPTIMHELSHFVDNIVRTKPITNNQTFDNCPDLNTAMYLFRPTELQARLVEYNERLKKNPQLLKYNVTGYMAKLHIPQMEDYLNMIKGASFKPGDTITTDGLLVIGIFYSESCARAMRRHNAPDLAPIIQHVNHLQQYDKVTTENFEKRKAAVVKLYEKRLRDFIHKALKIKYDRQEEFNQRKQKKSLFHPLRQNQNNLSRPQMPLPR